MATLQLRARHFGQALARAGGAMLQHTANAEARVLDYPFAVSRATPIGMADLGPGPGAVSRMVHVRAMLADVQGAPLLLEEDVHLLLDGVEHIIRARNDDTELQHTLLTLERLP